MRKFLDQKKQTDNPKATPPCLCLCQFFNRRLKLRTSGQSIHNTMNRCPVKFGLASLPSQHLDTICNLDTNNGCFLLLCSDSPCSAGCQSKIQKCLCSTEKIQCSRWNPMKSGSSLRVLRSSKIFNQNFIVASKAVVVVTSSDWQCFHQVQC